MNVLLQGIFFTTWLSFIFQVPVYGQDDTNTTGTNDVLFCKSTRSVPVSFTRPGLYRLIYCSHEKAGSKVPTVIDATDYKKLLFGIEASGEILLSLPSSQHQICGVAFLREGVNSQSSCNWVYYLFSKGELDSKKINRVEIE